MALLRQVQQEGFPGGYKAVQQWTLSRRIEGAEQSERQPEEDPVGRRSKWRRADFLAGQVVWLLPKDENRLEPDEWELLNVPLEKCPPVGQMRCLALDFRCLFKERNAHRLDQWLGQAAESGLPQPLATSLLRAREALLAAITLPWRNGPTEGVVNKIKLIKRQMDGRGAFETLRQRVLFAS